MRTYQEVDVKKRELVSITCDRCKTTYDDMMELQEFHTINFIGGYASVFGDDNTVYCDLCQHCLKELIGDFCRIEEE